MFAALLLIADGPAQAQQREEHEGEELQQIRGKWDPRVQRYAEIDAQQKSQQQNLECLQDEEEMALDPEGPPGDALAGVPARRIGWMSHDGEKLGPDLVCPRSGRRYREAGPDRIEEIT